MLHPDLEAIIPYLHTRNRDRLHPRDASQTNTSTEYSLPLANSPSTQPALSRTPHTNTHTPPLSRLRRAPIITPQPITYSSILDPSISLVVGIEWDTTIALNPMRILEWTPYRLSRAWTDCCYARGSQFVQYLVMASSTA